MYRLLKLKPTHSESLARLSLNNDAKTPEKSCLFCRILQNYARVSVSQQSTIVNPNPVVTQKVRKKRSKRFNTTELLEVSNKSTFQRTTKIQTANANDLKKFLETNDEMKALFEMKRPTSAIFPLDHTYNNLTVINQFSCEDNNSFETLSENDQAILSMLGIDRISSLQDPVIENNDQSEEKYEEFDETLDSKRIRRERLLINNDLILDSIPKFSFQPEVLEECHEEEKDMDEIRDIEEVKENKKTKTQTKTKKSKTLDINAKREIISKTLAAYIEVCSVLKANSKAMTAFEFFQGKTIEKGGIKIDDIAVYNALLKGCSPKDNVKKILDILDIAKQNNVQLNLQSYLMILHYIGKNKKQDIIKKFNSIILDGLKKGCTFNKIMNKGSFENFEREAVLQGIRCFNATFRPIYELPVVQYNNELVNSLNRKDQLKPPVLEKSTNRGLFSEEDLHKRVMKQVNLEKQISVTVANVEAKKDQSFEIIQYRIFLEDLYKTWRDEATKAFQRDLHSLSSKKGAFNHDIYMKSIPIDDFVSIIVDEAKKLAQGSETYSPTVNMLYRALGTKVYHRYKVIRKQRTGVYDKILEIHNDYCKHYAASHGELGVLPTSENVLNPRQKWQWLKYALESEGASLNMNHNEWPSTVMIEIGKFLYHIVMFDLKVDINCMKPNSKNKRNLPAFYTIFRFQGRITKEEVKPHPILSKLYRSSLPQTLNFPIDELPMLCPPVPWTNVHNGGYLITPCNMVRLPSFAIAQKQTMEATKEQNLYPSLDSLNQLASVPWKVNTKILDVILEVFNNGGSSRLDVPEPPSSLPPPEPPMPLHEMDKVQRYNFFRQKLQHRRKKGEMHSLRCDCLYRLSLANHYRDEIFWLPHNMDFRGRVYPIPPHLNHLGSDLARSILIFAESRPLGPKGLDWLKIHLVNLTGLKKRDGIQDRLQYANECMDLILDSADKPLTGAQWWSQSEEPWQTLACCIEIADALRSGNVANFRSHFPVHQDGSCNGLQHYAALGRDEAGGYSVNLCPSDKPQDVYSAVVALVEKRRKKDADEGLEIAKLLNGFVKRKVIKQTIMTTVYGVTKYGARLQIAKQLKDIDDFPKDQVFAASQYLTARTFESLRTMFTSTKEIQDWFTECARLISSVGGRHVEWVTPMGLPIVQPYFKFVQRNQNSIYDPYLIDKYERPNVMKQKNAFPPNFIHSLDSSHMMLTSLNCERAGITFVSVHDCFWTHASTVEIMNKICREQFVALHNQPILENLSIYLSEKYRYNDNNLANDNSVVALTKKKMNKVLSQLPKTGKLNINDVLKSVFFFS